MDNGLSAGIMILFLLGMVGCASHSASPGVKSSSAETRLQLGLIYLTQKQFADAWRHLQRAQELSPQDHRVSLALAHFYQARGEQNAAGQQYRKALLLSPKNGYILNNYGAFLCSLGQYELAHQQFSASLMQPDASVRADSLEYAGYCYLDAQDQQSAREMLTRAIMADQQKGMRLLDEASKRLEKGDREQAMFLSALYQHNLPASAESVWLEIRFAVLDARTDDIKRHGERLALHFPQSIQYQHFLANEY